MLSYLRTRATSSGFLGGSRVWMAIGFVVWTIKFFQWLTRPSTEVIYREPLGAGRSITIRHGETPPTKRQQKKIDKRAKADARLAKADARKNRKVDAKAQKQSKQHEPIPSAA